MAVTGSPLRSLFLFYSEMGKERCCGRRLWKKYVHDQVYDMAAIPAETAEQEATLM